MDCKDSASYLLGQLMCLEPFSKNVERGELRLVLDGPIEFCSGLTSRECNSYKTIHQLNLDIITNEPDHRGCNSGDQLEGGRRLDGRLYVCNLIHAFTSPFDPQERLSRRELHLGGRGKRHRRRRQAVRDYQRWNSPVAVAAAGRLRTALSEMLGAWVHGGALLRDYTAVPRPTHRSWDARLWASTSSASKEN